MKHGAHCPGMSWNLNFVLEWPGKSLNLGEFEILSWNVQKNIKIINETYLQFNFCLSNILTLPTLAYHFNAI